MIIIFSEVTELMKLNWCKSNEINVVTVIFSRVTGIMKWNWCKANETNVIVFVLSKNQNHQMKMM